MTEAPRTPTVLAAESYLLLFPAGHLLAFDVGGAVATAADAALLALLLAWGWDLATRRGMAAGLVAAVPGRAIRGYAMLLLFGVWVAASGLWGFHGAYAMAKGSGTLALGLGALALATSGMGWRRAADAWLGGAALALTLTLALGILGPDALRERVTAGGSGIVGLPFPRLSGTFLHPNMLGDYLVVSALLLWGRWPGWVDGAKGVAVALAAALGLGLALTASTAWVGAGVATALLGRRMSREGRGAWSGLLSVGGAVVAVGTFLLLVVPLDLRLLGLHLSTGAIRPAIWQSSLAAVAQSPVIGVGAAPYLAEAADRLQGGALGLWDAHNAYLSILGQFGVVGLALAGVGVWWVVVGAPAPREAASGVTARSRAQVAVGLALVAVAVNAVFLASEDLRHVWGLMGVVGAGRRGDG